jgi:hypothetical protein
LQENSFGLIVRIAQVALLAGNAEKGQAVDAVQTALGVALLLLGGLAAVLFAVILVLLEAKVILRLGGQLNQNLRLLAPPPAGRSLASGRTAPGPGPDEERRDDATR